jgi:hypothetical protein
MYNLTNTIGLGYTCTVFMQDKMKADIQVLGIARGAFYSGGDDNVFGEPSSANAALSIWQTWATLSWVKRRHPLN